MTSHGMSIDIRHVMLLADLMTYKVRLKGLLHLVTHYCVVEELCEHAKHIPKNVVTLQLFLVILKQMVQN